jgi:hypothetical protein
LSGRAAGWLGAAACAGALGAVVAAVACIPDLQDPATAADSGDDAGPVTPCGDGIVDLDAEQCDPGKPLPPDGSFAGCTGTCRMDCPPGGFVWPRNQHCYFKAGVRQSIQQVAATECANSLPNTRTHLVTFASEEEFEAVVGGIDAGPFWVGLLANTSVQANTYTSAQQYEPGWSPVCSGCFAHTDDASVPLGGTQDQGCVEGFPELDASWRQYSCNVPDAGKLIVICEREPNGTTARACDGGFCFEIPATYGIKHYLYVAKPAATADDARQACAARGGSLVVLESSEEREQIWYELSRLPSLNLFNYPNFWIGLSLADGGGWIWDDGTAADAYPSPWATLQPNVQAPDTTNAFLLQNPSQYDTTLALLNVPTTQQPYVCQIPVNAPDAGDAGEAGPEDASDAGSTE